MNRKKHSEVTCSFHSTDKAAAQHRRPQSDKSMCHGQNKYSPKLCYHLKLYCLPELSCTKNLSLRAGYNQPISCIMDELTGTLLSASSIQKLKFSPRFWNPALHSCNSTKFSMLRTTGAGSTEYTACRTTSASLYSCTYLSSKQAVHLLWKEVKWSYACARTLAGLDFSFVDG